MMNTKILTNLTLLESMDTSALEDIQKALYLIHKEVERVDVLVSSSPVAMLIWTGFPGLKQVKPVFRGDHS
jgi:predicted Zn-dependent protease